jgi:hypothetical protein
MAAPVLAAFFLKKFILVYLIGQYKQLEKRCASTAKRMPTKKT